MNPNDIVLVNFPFSDLTQTKLRPAVVVATPGGDNLILCQITTKKRSIKAYEVALPRSATQGDIRFDSNIYVDMLFTLHKNLVQQTIGSVHDQTTQRAITQKLRNLFS